jgi:archaellum biogenesis ATPase FlaH
VYFVPNPVKPELLARANNRINERPKQTTSDNDIRERRWLLIDLDPRRASGISSTDEEHAAAFELADRVKEYLTIEGWPDPIYADSGNGVHLVYPIELPNDDHSRQLIESTLKALDFLFSDEKVAVDCANFNAARIWKLYGTIAAKGDETPDRPHRPSLIIEAPTSTEPVSAALLEELARLAPKQPTRGPTSGQRSFDLAAWIRSHVDVAFEGAWQGGHRWILAGCPENPDEHTNRSAYIVQFPSGAIAAGCRHVSCTWRWSDLRAKYDPEYAERKFRVVEEPAPHVNGAAPKPKGKELGRTPERSEMARIKWLWPGRIPLGKLSDWQGDPGQGKSVVTVDIAATVSRGGTFPDGEACESGIVWIVSAEDDLNDTITPRLVTAGANLENIRVRTLSDGLLTLPDDLDWIADRVVADEVRLIILDPLDAFMSDDIDANKNQSVRRLLAKLATMAERTGCAVLVIRHLNKDDLTKKAMYRGGGSIGMNAAARQVMLVGPSPSDPKLKVLACTKTNLSGLSPSLAFRLIGVPVPELDGDEIVTVQWEEGTVAWTSDDLLKGPEKKRSGGTKIETCIAALEEIFADGASHLSEDVDKELRKHGDFSHATIATARRDLGITARKKGFTGVWVLDRGATIEVGDALETDDADPSDEGWK